MAIANTPNRRPILDRVARLVARSGLTASVAETYDLEEASEAHRAAEEGGYLGKLLVVP